MWTLCGILLKFILTICFQSMYLHVTIYKGHAEFWMLMGKKIIQIPWCAPYTTQLR